LHTISTFSCDIAYAVSRHRVPLSMQSDAFRHSGYYRWPVGRENLGSGL